MLPLLIVLLSTPPSLELILLDPDGSPAVDVRVDASVWTPDEDYQNNRELHTDDRGRIVVPLPDQVNLMRLFATPAGRVPMFIHWEQQDLKLGKEIPASVTVRLTKGETIGGVVLDPEGEPVEGATVDVRVEVSEAANERYRGGSHAAEVLGTLTWAIGAAKTDAEGRWRYDNAPAGEGVQYRIEAGHSDFIGPSVPQSEATTTALRREELAIHMRPARFVEGAVVGPDDAPVEGAVVSSHDSQFSRGPEAESGSDGTFRLGPFPADEDLPRLTVIADGLAPARIDPVAGEATRVELETGRPLEVRVVDGSGSPVKGARVTVSEYQGTDLLSRRKSDYRGTADENGLVTLPPLGAAGFIGLQLYAEGFASAEHRVGLASPGIELELQRPVRLAGRVVDAVTDEPIGSAGTRGLVYFRKDWAVEEGVLEPTDEGRFDRTFTRSDVEHGIIATAVGYRSAHAGPFALGEQVAPLELRLEPVEPLTFVVQTPDGEPAAGAVVEIATPFNSVDPIEDQTFMKPRCVTTAADGRVSLPTPHLEAILIARHDSGHLVVPLTEDIAFTPPAEMKLEPWAAVEAVVMSGDRSTDGERVSLSWPAGQTPGVTKPRVSANLSLAVDAEGRVRFDRVPAGPISISRYISHWDGKPADSSERMLLTLKPGETRTVRLNEGPGTVRGRVVLTGDGPSLDDLSHTAAFLVPAEAGDEWKSAWQEGDVWLSKPSVPATMLTLDADGTFVAKGLDIGEYTLAIAVHEDPQDGCIVGTVGQSLFPVSVTASQTDVLLSDVSIARHPMVAVGEVLPQAHATTVGGEPTYVAPTECKLTIVDFWASWCVPCREALPKFEALAEEFAGDDRVRVLSVNVDASREPADKVLEDLHASWDQLFSPSWFDTDAARQWGVTSLPAYLVFDREGQLLAREAKLEAAEAALRQSLAGDRP